METETKLLLPSMRQRSLRLGADLPNSGNNGETFFCQLVIVLSRLLWCDGESSGHTRILDHALTSNKPNKLAFLSMSAPTSYMAGLGQG